MIEPSRRVRGKRKPTYRRRGLTLLDLIIQVLGVALGLAWYQTVSPALTRVDRLPRWHLFGWVGLLMEPAYRYLLLPFETAFPCVAGLMIVVPLLRWSSPRPNWRIVRRQRGWTICLAASLVYVLQWGAIGAYFWYLKSCTSGPPDDRHLTPTEIYRFLGNWRINFQFFDPIQVIFAVWLIQSLTQKPPAEVDWVDRLGRWLGIVCLIGGVGRFCFRMIKYLDDIGLV